VELIRRALCRLGYHDAETAPGTWMLNHAFPYGATQDVVCIRPRCTWKIVVGFSVPR
jgi:hypothetical protein